MEATLPNFRTLFPEFEDPPFTDAKVEFCLDLAVELHSCSETAQLYLAAHFGALDNADGVGDSDTDLDDISTAGEGFATQQKVGDLSMTLAAPAAGSDADLLRTAYGRRAQQLINAAKTRLTVGVYA